MTTTDRRLRQAALEELVAAGYRGATTRSIAHRAGVNEVTLFRRFGSKSELIVQAIREKVAPFQAAVVEPSDDVMSDLSEIAAAYVNMVDSNPGLVARVIPELALDPEFRDAVVPAQAAVVDGLRRVMQFHQRHGRLRSDPADDALRAFMGPLAARDLMSHLMDRDDFDAQAYVARFLEGWQRAQ